MRSPYGLRSLSVPSESFISFVNISSAYWTGHPFGRYNTAIRWYLQILHTCKRTPFFVAVRIVSCQLSNHFASQRKFCCRGLCLRSRTTITTRECGVEGRKLISTLSGVCLCIWQQRGVAGVGEKKKSKTWLHRPQPAVLQMANAKWC